MSTPQKKRIIKKPELLAPAGSLEKLKIAVLYGADAVFIGGQEYSLRANADNFSLDEIAEGVLFAKKYGAKIYVTTNIFAHNENISGLANYLMALEQTGISGIIVSDPLIIETCKSVALSLELHLSTQQSTTNWQAVQFWKDQGIDRIVLARELSYKEIGEIKEKVDIELEVFIHGAMCIAYSGRCTLSNHMTARDSNRGGCCHSCRWDYDLYSGGVPEFKQTDLPFSMSPKDLNLLPSLPRMIDLGIDSLKIEGRMKSIHYVATVTSVYRKLIDTYCASPDNFVFDNNLVHELNKCANRDTASAFFEGVPDYKEQLFGEHSKKTSTDFAGVVLNYDPVSKIVTIQQRNNFRIGDTVEFFGSKLANFSQVVEKMWDEDGNDLDVARHPLMIVKFVVEKAVFQNDMMRRLK